MADQASLDERATISLPRLSVQEIERLFEHLAEHLPATIYYSVHEDNKCIYGPDVKGRDLERGPGSLSVSGTIQGRLHSSSFRCSFDSPVQRDSVAVGLRFGTAAFSRLEEFSEYEVQLWDDARQLINEYYL